ncbi:hypothetical protein SELMODRAFT_150725 [Selaginella moellendorffii]|uniref:ERD4-related membrane protein n=1 Tax=Selaginella moellendorffii TaxID=88036 RepID=D8RXA0_SELML|nr:calcium permeable stress-gated cation channel 1 [Selaginella moellendorffii]EFJ23221.1 hypothetical protein SELMODRAFT_150725 [Selaginella moellendorffii]|eukprot:XP_002975592.1 calcium permeable stress-gated cation channel 1 [Selaginella moellendorffii]
MATLQDLGVAAAINIISAFIFLLVFAFLKLQPANARVYYPKWYLKGVRQGSSRGDERGSLLRFVNLNYKSYLHFLDWMRDALRMPEGELIAHAGLDSVVYLRIYLLGLKVFVPLMLLGFLVLVPVNVTDSNIQTGKIFGTDIDKISLTNIREKSPRLWAHVVMTYVFTAWTCFMLFTEYKTVARMRFQFLAAEARRPDQFTVLVRQVPLDPDEPISTHIDHFFRVNHPDYYLCNQVIYNANKLAKLVKKREGLQNWLDYYQLQFQRKNTERPMTKTGLWGLWGQKVDAIQYYTDGINQISKEATVERERVLNDDSSKLPVAFVSFRSRWGAAVCAQTQQTRDPTVWLTEWAPEPRDVYWRNLSVPYLQLTMRKLFITGAVFLLIFFYIIPVTFVQSLANLEGIEKKLTFLRPIIEAKFIKSFLQGFLPGLALKLFLHFLPKLLMFMSKIEGHLALSQLEVSTSAKYYYFMVVNVFFASVIAGAAFEQLKTFFQQSPSQIPVILAGSIPQKATFFITYIMVDGWASIAADIMRIKPLIVYHLKNMFLVKTDKDRENAMSPGSAGFDTVFPQLELYFLLGTVYSIITPFILPFIIVYLAFAYVVYRHQVINVYDPEYESAAAFWPHIHNRIIVSLLVEQITLFGVFAGKRAAASTPLLIGLPIMTIVFHYYCKNRFEPAFRKYPLEEAMSKDIVDRATHPNWNIKTYLQNSYMHPVFKDSEEEMDEEGFDAERSTLVPTKKSSRSNTPAPSANGEESPFHG